MASESSARKLESIESLGRVLGSRKQSPTCVVGVCTKSIRQAFVVPGSCMCWPIDSESLARLGQGLGSWVLDSHSQSPLLLLLPFSSLLYLQVSIVILLLSSCLPVLRLVAIATLISLHPAHSMSCLVDNDRLPLLIRAGHVMG
jgi:hypothetical protein